MIEIELYKPFEHQAAVHRAITNHINTYIRGTEEFQKTFVVKAMRQVGKTAMATNELLRFALESKTVNGYVAPTLKLSKKTFREIKDLLIGTGLMKGYNGSDLIIEFINGSSINFFSAEQGDNLRGFTITGLLVIDEAAYIQDSIYEECLSPWTDFHKAITLIISTPKFFMGFFYKLYMEGLLGMHSVESIDWSSYDVSYIRSEKMLAQKRRTLPALKFKAEYLGEFIEGEGTVFSRFDDLLINVNSVNNNKMHFGLDWGTGSGQDSTALVAFNGNGEMCYLWGTNTLSPVEQINKIIYIINSFGTKVVSFTAEENSIGKVYLDMLRKAKIKVKPFTTTNSSKRKLVEDLQVAIEQKKIRLADNETLKLQLASYESKITNNMNVTYNAPPGMNDDYVIATLLAYRGFKYTGVYGISIL